MDPSPAQISVCAHHAQPTHISRMGSRQPHLGKLSLVSAVHHMVHHMVCMVCMGAWVHGRPSRGPAHLHLHSGSRARSSAHT